MYKLILLASILVATSSYANTFIVSDVREFRNALENAALNGEHDTIVLQKGVYHTNSDGAGAFAFSDQEAYDLTVEADTGLTAKDVVLDGDGISRVFTYFNSVRERLLTLKNISLINGLSTSGEGGCIYTYLQNLTLDHSLVSKCKSTRSRGGAISSWRHVTLLHSTVSDSNLATNDSGTGTKGGGIYARTSRIEYSNIINNHGGSQGGGVYSVYATTVINSTISNNSTGSRIRFPTGGGIHASAVFITESNITNNTSYTGGGLHVYATVNIDKSIISRNSASFESALHTDRDGKAKITNSLFSNNRGGPSFIRSNTSYYINNNFIDNEGYLQADGVLINNIFKSSVNIDLSLTGDTKLYNNYIDYSKITQYGNLLIKSNNLNPIYVGDIQLWIDDLMLRTDSPARDVGLDPRSTLFEFTIDDIGVYNYLLPKLRYDIYLNPRNYNDTTIDIGASEYGYANYPLSVAITPLIMYLLN